MKNYSHQEALLQKNPHRWLLAHGTGTGKTHLSINLAIKNKLKTVIVITIKSLKEQWRREIAKRVNPLQVGNWKVFTKEEFKKIAHTLGPVDGVIVDEAHYFAGFRNTRDMSQLHRALFMYFKKWNTEYRWLLTATPYLSTAMNIFALARLLGHNWNYMAFKNRFFSEVRMGMKFVWVQKAGIEEELKVLVNILGNTVAMEDVADVPEQKFEVEKFELTESQRHAIDNLSEINQIVRFTKIHEIENGTMKDDGYAGPKFYDCKKNDRIIEIVRENSKTAIFCRYTAQIEMLRQLLSYTFDPIFVIQGDVKDRDSVVKAAESAERCVVLINASCSEGYELPSIGTIVFASMSFSLKDYLQCQGRFLRINKLKENRYIHLIGGDIDQAVYDAMMKKQDFHLEIYAKEHGEP